MAWDEPAQHVDQVLARLGRKGDRLATNHYRSSPVGLGLVGVFCLVPVVDSVEKVTVAVARFAAG